MLLSYVYCTCKTPKKSQLFVKLNFFWPLYQNPTHALKTNHFLLAF